MELPGSFSRAMIPTTDRRDAIFDPFPSAQWISLEMADKSSTISLDPLSKTCNIPLCSVRKTALYMGTGSLHANKPPDQVSILAMCSSSHHGHLGLGCQINFFRCFSTSPTRYSEPVTSTCTEISGLFWNIQLTQAAKSEWQMGAEQIAK